MGNELIPERKNSEGYSDPTAYNGMKNAMSKEIAAKKLCDNLIGTIKLLAHLAGFEIVGRIQLKHKETGMIFR